MSTSDNSNDKNHEIKKIEETQPVVWTPEDASRFLTSAIHEAQRPLADALKQRPITTKALFLLVGVIVIAGIAIALILASQLEKSEKRADSAMMKHDDMLVQKYELQSQHDTLQDRMSSVSQQHEELKGHVDNLRGNEDAHRRTRTDLSKFRRHNEALRGQISGLEMEKAALARQLEAMKAMMAEPDEDEEDLEHPFDWGNATDDEESDSPETAAPEEDATPPEDSSQPAAAQSFVSPEPAADPKPASEEPQAATPEPDASSAPDSETPAVEPEVKEPEVEEPAAAEPARPEPEPAAEQVSEASSIDTAPQSAAEPTPESEPEPETKPAEETPDEAEPAAAKKEAAATEPADESEPVDAATAATEAEEPPPVSDTAAKAAAALEKAEAALRAKAAETAGEPVPADKYLGITGDSVESLRPAAPEKTGESEPSAPESDAAAPTAESEMESFIERVVIGDDGAVLSETATFENNAGVVEERETAVVESGANAE